MSAVVVIGALAVLALAIACLLKLRNQPYSAGTWLLLGLVRAVGRIAGWWTDFHRALDGFAREWVAARCERAGVSAPPTTAVERFNEF